MENKIYDLIIIGGGPAGLTGALYASRRKLSTLVLTKDIGGQAATTNEIENWPGIESIDGPTLMNNFHKHAEKFGAEFVFQGVESIEHEEKENLFIMKTAKGEYKSQAVIIAFGLEHRKLGVPGENEFYGKGITYCATCDGPFFKDKEICIVGGGNSALDAADYMSKLASKVHMYIRKDKFRGEQVLIDSVKNNDKIQIHFNTSITEIQGDQFVNKVKLINNETKEESEQELQGVFVEIGYVANTKLYENLVDMTQQGAIIIDAGSRTSKEGVFAAGDITTLEYKQIITSGGEGCKAALSAYSYIQKKKGVEVSKKADR